MTQDEIIEMAKQSELGFLLGDNWMLHHELEYFAKLVAQHEREACAKVCDEQMRGKSIWIKGAEASALAIRARGQA
jgi:hypothetical protein